MRLEHVGAMPSPEPTDMMSQAQEDAEMVEFHALLLQLRDVRYGGEPVTTRRGLRIRDYTAACPVNPSHRMQVSQVPGGAMLHCDWCAQSSARSARFGRALARRLGREIVR